MTCNLHLCKEAQEVMFSRKTVTISHRFIAFNTVPVLDHHVRKIYKSYLETFRSSRSALFCKKGVLRNFGKFTVKHLCQSLFFNKVAGLRPAA